MIHLRLQALLPKSRAKLYLPQRKTRKKEIYAVELVAGHQAIVDRYRANGWVIVYTDRASENYPGVGWVVGWGYTLGTAGTRQTVCLLLSGRPMTWQS